MDININTSLPVTFEEIPTPDYINDDRFMCAKVWVCHTGKNLNNSIFSKDVITDMIPSLVGIPIVGYIEVDNANEEDFAGHEERIIIDNDGVKVEYVGRGYGCVIESNNAKFEKKICEDGIEREFLTCEVLLWRQFENCIDIFERDGKKGHSMELQPSSIEGYLDSDKVFNFTKAKFRALCILGDNRNPAMIGGLIEKFESNFSSQFETILTEINNSIKQFTLQNQTAKIDFYYIDENKAKQLVDKANNIFKKLGFDCKEWVVDGKEYQITGVVNKILNKEATENWGFNIYDKDTVTISTNNLDELNTSAITISSVDMILSKTDGIQKFSLIPKKMDKTIFNKTNNKEGGSNDVDEKLQLIAKYNLTAEQLDFSIEEISLEDLETKLKEFDTKDNEPVLFSATYNQKREAINNALDNSVVKDEQGNIVEETYYWVSDFDDEYCYVNKDHWVNGDYDSTYGRFTYTFDEENLTATITSEFEQMIRVWLTVEENQKLQDERNNASENYEKLKGDFEEYKNNYSTQNSEVERLKKFETDTLTKQRKDAETELFERFSELNGNDEFETLKTKSSEFKMDALEKECFVILGKKSATFSAKTPTGKTKVKLEFTKEKENTTGEFDELFDKYLNKNEEE